MSVVQLPERRSPEGLSVSPCSAGPTLVVVISGEADWDTADQLREGLVAALAYGPRSMVLDLTDLTFCSLQGLRALLAAVETAGQTGVEVTLRGMSRQLEWLCDLFQEGGRTSWRQCRPGGPGSGARRAALRSVPIV